MSTSAEQTAQFVAMSVILTGFGTSVISPSLDPINLKSQYLEVLNNYDSDLLSQLLQQFDSLVQQGLSSQEIADQLVDSSAGTNPSQTGQLARSVILLWYLGSFYPPNQPGTSQVVSANAYTGGLAWRVAQTKAMGFSEQSFGYWETPPLPLSDFLGKNTGESND